MKKSFIKSLILILMTPFLTLTGCSNNSGTNETNTDNLKVGYQLDPPQKGEEIAVMTTNMGEIKLRFFPEFAPKAVENFKTHSKNGYYNGLIFHRVIKDFMIQGGDPKGNGTGGESIWGKAFEDEFSDKLFNITGAVAMANSGKNTNGSQFFINNVDKNKFIGWEKLQTLYNKYKNSKKAAVVDMSKITDEIKELYNNNGGNPTLDGYFNSQNKGHTVFAQVFSGMDTVNKISNVETNSSNNKPTTDVIIEKIEIINFEE